MSQIIPVPVQLNVEESINQFALGVAENSVQVSFGVSTQIVAGTTDEYAGPYSVTPSESAQTLDTDGLLMTDDVNVSAIPSDYVGSDVPRHDSSDLVTSGATVSVPAGYYAENASKSIQNATVKSGTNVTVNPTLSVNYDTGEITASVSKTQSVNVVTEAGYAPVTSHNVVMSGSAATQLITHDSSDLTVSGNTVTAPDGYYPNPASKTIPDAVANQVTMSVSPQTPTVNSSGLVTASVGTTQGEIAPFTSEGYVGTNYKIQYKRTGGSKTLQLDTQAAATITPTESEQTAVASGKYTTGAVKVGAISSDYVGSGVTRNDSSDLSVSGDTVTAPAGYYENAASATVQSATWKSASTIGVVPSISVDANGLITATASGWTSCKPLSASGYADADTSANLQLSGSKTSQLDTIGATTYTPTKGTAQTIPLGKFLTGDQTISAIPDSWYDMGGALSWFGAGAELVTTFTLADVKLSATDFNTWTPSTTAADILATRNAGTFTATDAPNWNYFIVWETKIPIVYASAGTNKAKPLFLASIIINAIFRRPSSYDNVIASNYNNTVNATAYTGNFLRYYGTTTNSKTYIYNASYGLYGTATAATFSSATADSPTVTAKTPKISARCSTTYMSTTNAGYIDKDKTIISQKGYVYKAKLSTFLQGCYEREIAFVNEVDA